MNLIQCLKRNLIFAIESIELNIVKVLKVLRNKNLNQILNLLKIKFSY